MNKEIKDRLDKLENELKESKNEIHSLKSSVSLTIERVIRKVLSRFSSSFRSGCLWESDKQRIQICDRKCNLMNYLFLLSC